MNKQPFRIGQKPKRLYKQTHTSYQAYKDPLRDDFHCKCGYCDIEDGYFSGKDSFHIDHFAPKKKFPDLKTNYDNLVYSCPYCNRGKSDDWVTEFADQPIKDGQGYIDPCEESYEKFFCRDKYGNIIPENSVAIYMYNQMKFFLQRHSLLWNLRKIDNILMQLREAIDKRSKDDDIKNKLMQLYYDLSKYFMDYLQVKKEGLN